MFSNLFIEIVPVFFPAVADIFPAVAVVIVDVVRFAVEIILRKIKHVNTNFITTHKRFTLP